MDNHNSDNSLQSHLNEEFQKIDKLISEFQNDFIEAQAEIVKEYLCNISREELNEDLLLYANEIFNIAESVYDKDVHYSEIRLKEELQAMTRVVSTRFSESEDACLAEQTHLKAKEIMVSFFPNLINLSGNGFRLLEKYCQMFNREFVVNLQAILQRG